jgi:hypothetical protein
MLAIGISVAVVVLAIAAGVKLPKGYTVSEAIVV